MNAEACLPRTHPCSSAVCESRKKTRKIFGRELNKQLLKENKK